MNKLYTVIFILLTFSIFSSPGQSQSSSPLLDVLQYFGFNGEYYYTQIASPILYETSEGSITLSSYSINLYDINLNYLRTFDIPGEFEWAYVGDISSDYALMYLYNNSGIRSVQIYDRNNENVLDPSYQFSTTALNEFISLENNTIQVVYYNQEVNPANGFNYFIELYDFISNEQLYSNAFTFQAISPSNFGTKREVSVSAPIQLNASTFKFRQTITYYADVPGTQQQLHAYEFQSNTDTGQTTYSSFTSQSCDRSFQDKSEEFTTITQSRFCRFFVDYETQSIYFARLMDINNEDSILSITNKEGNEISTYFPRTYLYLDPYSFRINENTFFLFFLNYDRLMDGKLDYVNIELDFQTERVLLNQDVLSVTKSKEFQFFLNDAYTKLTYHSATLDGIFTIEKEISKIEYTSSYTSVSESSPVDLTQYLMIIPMLIVLSKILKQRDVKN